MSTASEKLTYQANKIRRLIVQSVALAGSGHWASPIALADFFTIFYGYILHHRPQQAHWSERDKFFLSAGHICPVLYASLAIAGYFGLSELFSLRKLGSRLQGHPHRNLDIGIENSSGPLGQGVGMAVGCAIEHQRRNSKSRIYVLSSDGEQQEGQVWEAYQLAAQENLSNFTIIIDVNNIQISGCTSEIMNQRDLAAKMSTFGFAVFKANGHDFDEIAKAFIAAKKETNRPQAIIMDTIPGRGISFMENDYRWHSGTMDIGQVTQALQELGVKDFSKDSTELEPEFIDWYINHNSSNNSKNYENQKSHEKNPFPLSGIITKEKDKFATKNEAKTNFIEKKIQNNNSSEEKLEINNQTPQKATREGFGQAVNQLAAHHPELIVACADLSTSLCLDEFYQNYPDQYLEIGVAEQNLASTAAGLAMADKTVLASSFAAFNPGRNWEQIRVGICEQNLNVKIIGSHAGLNTGEDGATHQALEDIALMRVLPKMTIIEPCDFIEARKATKALIENHSGPAYLRLCRQKSPQITHKDDEFIIGKANLLKNGNDATIIASGYMVNIALKAAQELQTKHQLNVRVLNMHTIKPLDTQAIYQAATQTGAIITIEDHQIRGGLGGAVCEYLSTNLPIPVELIGVQDIFGQSGQASELLEKYQLTTDNLINKTKTCINRKKLII